MCQHLWQAQLEKVNFKKKVLGLVGREKFLLVEEKTTKAQAFLVNKLKMNQTEKKETLVFTPHFSQPRNVPKGFPSEVWWKIKHWPGHYK